MKKKAILLMLILCLSLFSVFQLRPGSGLTVELEEDFENWNENGWSTATGGGGTVDVPSSAAAHAGSYGAYLSAYNPSTPSYGSIYKTVTERLCYYVDFYYKTTDITLISDSYARILRLNDDWDENYFEVDFFEAEGNVFSVLYIDGDYNTKILNSSLAITENDWLRVTLGINKSETQGFIRLWVDEQLIISASGQDTDANGVGITEILLNTFTNTGSLLQSCYDDVFIQDEPPEFTIYDQSYFWEDFEDWNINNWINHSNTAGYPKLSSTAHSGSYGLVCTAEGQPGDPYIYFDYNLSDEIGLDLTEWYLEVNLMRMGLEFTDNTNRIIDVESVADLIFYITLYEDSGYWDYRFHTWLPSVPDDQYLGHSTGEWDQFVFYFHEDPTAGDLDIWLNTDLVFSFDGDTTSLSSPNVLDYLFLGIYDLESEGGAVYFDDIELRNFNWQYPYVTAEGLENIDDGADWVFTDWKYYPFILHVTNGLEDLRGALIEAVISFTVTTGGTGDVLCTFTSDSENWTLTTDLDEVNETRFGQPVLLRSGSWSNNTITDETEITFLIWFNGECLDIYDDPIDVDANVTWATAGSFYYEDAASDLFYIYSKGGFERNLSITGDAGRITGGEWCSLYGHNGSEVQNEIWFRDLQHIKLLPEINFLLYEAYYIDFFLEFSIGEGEWLPGIKGRLYVDAISYTGWLAGNVWINYTVSWWRGTGEPDTYENIDSDDIYMFYHGGIVGEGDDGRHKFWVDLWFNSINASSTIGGRVNAYEYPMKDGADPWLKFFSSNWGVKDDVMKESMRMFTLNGSSQEVISAQTIKMVRAKVLLHVNDADLGQYCVLHPYDVLDYTLSHQQPLTGIQTPVFDETKIPTMSNTGFLGFLWSAFSGLGAWLSENVIFGGLNLWGNFVAFLDTIAAWFGAPGFFSTLFSILGSAVSYLIDSITYLFQMVYNVFLLIGALLASFVTLMGEMITSFVTTLGYFGDFVDGGIGTAGNLWEQLGISGWITLAMILYPIYLIVLWDTEGMDAVMKQLTMIFGILSWLINFFIQIITVVMGFITGLIESVPVAE